MNSTINLTEEDIQTRINEINSELTTYKDSLPEDIDSFLELEYLINDLQTERTLLVKQRDRFHEVEQDSIEDDYDLITT